MDPPSAPQLLPKGVRQACNWTLSPLLSLVSGCRVTVAHHLSCQTLCTSQSPLCERFLFYSVLVPCLVPPQKNPVLSGPSQIETNSVELPGQHHKQYLVAGPQGQPPSRFWGLDSQEIPRTSGSLEIRWLAYSHSTCWSRGSPWPHLALLRGAGDFFLCVCMCVYVCNGLNFLKRI